MSSSLASRSQLAKIQKVEDNRVDLQVSTLVDQRFLEEPSVNKEKIVQLLAL